MRYNFTAGLPRAQMTELIARCWQVHSGRQSGEQGRYAFVLPFGKAVSMVLIMARHNLAQQLTGDLPRPRSRASGDTCYRSSGKSPHWTAPVRVRLLGQR